MRMVGGQAMRLQPEGLEFVTILLNWRGTALLHPSHVGIDGAIGCGVKVISLNGGSAVLPFMDF